MTPFNVAELAQSIDATISRNYLLRGVRVVGHIVSSRTSIRGHVFFTLADLNENVQISGLLFQSRRHLYEKILMEGERVIISGNISYYMPNGTIRLLAEQVTPLGQSIYAKQWEHMRQEMEDAGYFSPDRKRNLPQYVFSVALISSPVGAVVHDVMQRIHERSPFVACHFIPTQVQGEGAEESIAAGIVAANSFPDPPDVLIIARGGGSREELATFDSPLIIEAAVQSAIPIISAIGHESDSPLLDLAADIRAATPTHAAEIVTASTMDLQKDFVRYKNCLTQAVINRQKSAFHQLQFFLARNMYRSIQQILSREASRLQAFAMQTSVAWNQCFQATTDYLSERQKALLLVSPETMFRNGYMWIARGQQVRKLSYLAPGDVIQLEDGEHIAEAMITAIQPRKDNSYE